ncbi:ATP-binding protein [Dolichospermum sp. ST_con]|nr:ATP-binding protein [Dolichospermum sp. ST_con]MDD1419470.1 ATP-binding protein [Dolichospermum sp. ST_sed1]MDD1423330.1 ATP-binding protein [Dolichospermum sp. ST_sed9]MDD1431690.1 ATP-binding protein [Dolichospermum sp. ST_sed6]MDD1435145.1 ATP-binding protein [Dolichospermum sp. ST_sed10]MDD1440214.1 ATP-binding protein [Dolichospermum sp. ST_sed3]MDD1447262.1 ATP-binding protein [Dolichospermum sp. ST_sed8]MDD1455085.1 ATP-binding protein [Dolichospermum sp. ST_sed7]MDD1459184.1 ATP-
MEAEKALESIQQRLRKPLNSIESKVFTQIWKGKTYDEMLGIIYKSNDKPYSEAYFVEVANKKLFPRIKTLLNNDDIDKYNFKEKIEIFLSNDDEIIESPEDNQNPFLPLNGKVDTPKQFFGREKEIGEILDFLKSSCNVSIIGDDGIGKSSLLWAICQQNENLINLKRKFVFMDLNEHIDNQETFYEELFYRIGISSNLSFRDSKRDLENKKILLILDNVSKLSEFTPGVRGQLRSWSEGMNAPLKLVVAANKSLPELFNDYKNGINSPLEAICQQVNIFHWNEPTIREFITKRLQPTTIDFTEADIQKLIQASGGHPQKLTQLCYDLYKKYSHKNNI